MGLNRSNADLLVSISLRLKNEGQPSTKGLGARRLWCWCGYTIRRTLATLFTISIEGINYVNGLGLGSNAFQQA